MAPCGIESVQSPPDPACELAGEAVAVYVQVILRVEIERIMRVRPIELPERGEQIETLRPRAGGPELLVPKLGTTQDRFGTVQHSQAHSAAFNLSFDLKQLCPLGETGFRTPERRWDQAAGLPLDVVA